MTLRQAAQSALDVQTACNLSGVARSFAEVTHFLRTLPGIGTAECNTHPISRLYAEQIGHLTGAGVGDSVSYSRAYDACMALAATDEAE